MEQKPVYICIDLKSFYASVECVERGLDPMTADHVVADPQRTEKTICLAVSPSLKAKGVRNRCRVFEIPKHLDYITATPRMQKYIDYSAEIYGIYLKYISKDDILVYSVDEVFMDVTHYLTMYSMSAGRLAAAIMADILQTTGIPATCGIGSNLYLAKVALDITAKHVQPDSGGARIGILDVHSYRKTLWEHRPLTDFWRIGTGISNRLAKYGIFTMGDIAAASIDQEDLLYRLFGVDAELLIDHAWGEEPCTMEDIKAYQPQTNCISSGQVLQSGYTWEKARLIVQEMTDALVLDLVDREVTCASVTLHVGYDNAKLQTGAEQIKIDYYGRKVPSPAHGTARLSFPTNSKKLIMEAVTALYDRITDRRLLVRRFNMTANRVEKEVCQQYDLFTSPAELAEEKAMQQALLAIKKKFGKNAIVKGMDLEEGATAMERNCQIGGHKA